MSSMITKRPRYDPGRTAKGALGVFIKALHVVHPIPNRGHAFKLVVGSVKNSLFYKKVFTRAKPT